MKVLSIVESAYRATVEEQDDTIVWLNAMFADAGLDVDLLLRSQAVNYLVRGQDASSLAIGGEPLGNPPRLDEDVAALIARGSSVYFVSEDAAELGVSTDRMIDAVRPVTRSELPRLFAEYDQVWHW
ncbi:MAG: hypothetical protein KatS3mg008_1002 [Acidimicrobiales bacterium]|nr:MAG: hypothetical protein KatS3mg008_1002 [Acidimicrobiales bacterium]